MPRILTISTGRVMPLLVPNPHNPGAPYRTTSAIRKAPVSTLAEPDAVAVQKLGLEGDEQSDHTVHGGLDKAVYAYPAAHYADWVQRLEQLGLTTDRLQQHGAFGENLTVDGLDEQTVFLGDRWIIGEVELIVTAPREPCAKFNAVMGHKGAARDMMASGQSGWYLSVSQPGMLRANAQIEVLPGSRQHTVREALAQRTRRSQDA